MKFLAWIELKFGVADRSRGWLIRRKVNKKNFIVKYQTLCDKMFANGATHSDYKTTDGLQLVGLARRELKYSDTTYGGDILYGLFREWQNLKSQA